MAPLRRIHRPACPDAQPKLEANSPSLLAVVLMTLLASVRTPTLLLACVTAVGLLVVLQTYKFMTSLPELSVKASRCHSRLLVHLLCLQQVHPKLLDLQRLQHPGHQRPLPPLLVLWQ